MPREGVRQIGTAYVVSVTPDVCLTPMGANSVPVPYPIIGVFTDVALVAMSVRMCRRPTFTTSSQVTRVQGDEAGPFGVKSGTNRSICESVTASTTVRAEGNYILRDGDVMKMNNGNTLGKVVYMPGVGPMIVGNPSDFGFWDAAWDDLKETWEAAGGTKAYLLDLWVPGAGQAYNQINSAANDPTGAILNATPGVGQVYQSYKAIGKINDAYKKGGMKAVAGRLAAETAKAAAQYATGEMLNTASPNAADTTKMDTAPPADTNPAGPIENSPPGPKAGDTIPDGEPSAEPNESAPGATDNGLQVSGAAIVDPLGLMLGVFSEEVLALLSKAETLMEQLNKLALDGWTIVRNEKPGFWYNKYVKVIHIQEGFSAEVEAKQLAHEAGHASPEGRQPVEPALGLDKDEYVREYVRNNLREEGRAQYNAARARAEILKNGGDDIGMPGNKDNWDAYQEVYDDEQAGLISKDQAYDEMGDIMSKETRSSDGKPYGEYFADQASNKYDQLNNQGQP
jgi:hypothetical protein